MGDCRPPGPVSEVLLGERQKALDQLIGEGLLPCVVWGIKVSMDKRRPRTIPIRSARSYSGADRKLIASRRPSRNATPFDGGRSRAICQFMIAWRCLSDMPGDGAPRSNSVMAC